MKSLVSLIFLAIPLMPAAEIPPYAAALRVQAGLAENTGYQGRINLTAFNIFNDGSRYSTGLCVSARLLFTDAVNATLPDTDTKDRTSIAGGQFMAGVSSIVDDYSHIEILVGGGFGTATEKGNILNYGSDGTYKQWAGEVGYYRVISRKLEVGIAGGFSGTNATLDNGGSFKARSSGIDLVLSVGMRL